MQRMRPDIPPVPIQARIPRRSPRSRNLKHPRRNPQRRVRRHDLRTRHKLRHIASLSRRHIPLLAMRGIDGRELGHGLVNQRLGGEQVRVEVAVALEDVEFVGRLLLVLAAEGPWARGRGGVFLGGLDGALRDAEVEVGEDELDGWEEEGGERVEEDFGDGSFGHGVPA